MTESKSTVSDAKSYVEMGEFWDSHDITDYADDTSEVEFDIDIRSHSEYFPLGHDLSQELREAAANQGVSASTLLNLWVQEKLRVGTEGKSESG